MKKALLLIFGGLLTVLGGVIFMSPMPLGFLLLLPGIAMLIMGSSSVANWIQRRRERNAELDEKLAEAQEHVPGKVEEPLERTEPEEGSH